MDAGRIVESNKAVGLLCQGGYRQGCGSDADYRVGHAVTNHNCYLELIFYLTDLIMSANRPSRPCTYPNFDRQLRYYLE